MRVLGLGAAALVALAGCTTVKLAQRDGCWIRRTERAGNVHEELGPCLRPPTPWSEDKVTRLVQECVVAEDYRWQGRALAVWSRGDPLPPREADETVLQRCMTEAARTALTQEQKDAAERRLAEATDAAKERIAEVKADRDALRAAAGTERERLAASNEKLADHLGEAARKPSPPAVATATATSEGRMRSDGAPQATLAAPAATPAAPAAPPITITAQGGAAPPAATHTTPACASPPPRSARRGPKDRTPSRAAPCAAPDAPGRAEAPAAGATAVTPAAAKPDTPAP